MKHLRAELRPDFETAEKLYPLILSRLQEYEAFHDSQSEDTPEEVFEVEYQKMQTYLSELTGKDLSDVWLWEWWEGNGIEVFAFDLAMPEPKKHNDLTKEDLRDFVEIICTEHFDYQTDFEEEFMPYMFYNQQYFFRFLELNFKGFRYDFFIQQKDQSGNDYEPTTDEIVEKIWNKKK